MVPNDTQPMASLGLVSPGAVTDCVTPYFFLKKLTTFFCHRNLQSDDLFQLSSVVLSHFPPSDLICLVFFLNSATKFFLFHSGVTWGGPPPSDATALRLMMCWQPCKAIAFSYTETWPVTRKIRLINCFAINAYDIMTAAERLEKY